MKEAIDKIKEYVDLSSGDYVEIGDDEYHLFRVTKKYTMEELADFEKSTGITIPADYKYFLTELGTCEIFSQEGSHYSIEFHKLDKIYELYKEFFTKPDEWLFKKYFPIGMDNGLEEVFGYSFYFKEPESFFILKREHRLEELNENDPWFPGHFCKFSDYLAEVVKNKGELEPHQ